MGRGTTLASAHLEIGGADYGATKRVNVCRSMWRGRVRAVTATGALGGAPYGATKRVRGVPKWGGARMLTQPRGPSLEFPMGPRNV